MCCETSVYHQADIHGLLTMLRYLTLMIGSTQCDRAHSCVLSCAVLPPQQCLPPTSLYLCCE